MDLLNLEKLCRAGGVGNCRQAAETALKLLETVTDSAYIDEKGNVIGYKNCARPDAPLVLLEAHIDEVGFVVTRTDDDGFLWVDACGRSDDRALSAQPVQVYTKNDVRNGVFCSVPPHLQKDEHKLPKVDELGIDIGLTAGETIEEGTFVGFAPHFEQYGEQICSKALDDRCGVWAILSALSKAEQLDFRVAVAFCSAEELGCRNAGAVAAQIQPDIALAVDVSFAYVPGSKAHQCGRMGQGVMIGYSPCLDRALSDKLKQLAIKERIAYQCEIMSETTGTDADRISVSAQGIRTGLLSIPLKYMHTPVERVDVGDIEATAALIAAFLSEGGQAI